MLLKQKEQRENFVICNGLLLCFCFIVAIFTVCALNINFCVVPMSTYEKYTLGNDKSVVNIVAQLRYMLRPSGIQNTLICIWLTRVYYISIVKMKYEISLVTSIFAGIFTFLYLIGKCYKDAGNMDFLITSYKYFIFSVLLGIGVFVPIYIILSRVYQQLKTFKVIEGNIRYQDFFDKYSFPISFIIIIIGWIPYLCFFYPGVVNWDGIRQLDFYLGSLEWTTHHPALSTMLIGISFSFGKTLTGNDNVGIFMYIMLQYIAGACIFAKGVECLKKWNVCLKYRLAILFYFAFFSIWQIYSVTYIKDTSYYLMIFLFFVCLIDIYTYQDKKIKRDIIFGISGIMSSLLRNDGIFVVGLTMIAMIVVFKDIRRRLVKIFLVTVIVVCCFNTLLVPSMGILPGSKRESLSIPFQQTARYVKEYYNEVTDEERQIIDKILDYEKLPQLYNPDISDPVKASKFNEPTSEEMKQYFEVWFKQMFKHPLVYIESIFNSCYKIFYIDSCPSSNHIGDYAHATNKYVVRGDVKFEFIEKFEEERKIIENTDYIFYNLPLLSIFYSPALYTWMFIFCIYIVIRMKRYKQLILFVPILIVLLINIASPINGSLRYMLPVLACMPILLVYIIGRKKKEN